MSSTTFPTSPIPMSRRLRSPGAAAIHARSAAPEVLRRKLTAALGLLWLIDAGLQFQPYMFTTDFPNQAIKPVGLASPAFVRVPSQWAADLMAAHILVWNTLFALTQLAIAVGLLCRRTTKPALAASIAWAVAVWWLGEGLGGVLGGPVSPLAGLPGAVILYALVAVLVWPRSGEPRSAPTPMAFASPLRRPGAKLLWLLLWLTFGFEAMRPANRSPSALHDAVSASADGEPAWIKAVVHSAAGLGHHGTEGSCLLAAALAAIAVSVLIPRISRLGVLLAIMVSLLIWTYGEAFGALATGRATDPNSGPALVLLACCFWPARSSSDRTRTAARASRAPSSGADIPEVRSTHARRSAEPDLRQAGPHGRPDDEPARPA